MVRSFLPWHAIGVALFLVCVWLGITSVQPIEATVSEMMSTVLTQCDLKDLDWKMIRHGPLAISAIIIFASLVAYARRKSRWSKLPEAQKRGIIKRNWFAGKESFLALLNF